MVKVSFDSLVHFWVEKLRHSQAKHCKSRYLGYGFLFLAARGCHDNLIVILHQNHCQRLRHGTETANLAKSVKNTRNQANPLFAA